MGVLPGLNGDPPTIPEERVSVVSLKTTATDTDTDLSIWGGNFMRQIDVSKQNQENHHQTNGWRFPSFLIFLLLIPTSWPNNTSQWVVRPSIPLATLQAFCQYFSCRCTERHEFRPAVLRQHRSSWCDVEIFDSVTVAAVYSFFRPPILSHSLSLPSIPLFVHLTSTPRNPILKWSVWT